MVKATALEIGQILTHEYDKSVKITWSSHNSLLEKSNQFEVGISSLMPLLRDQAHDVATIKHSLDMIEKAVSFLNPTQSHVVTVDQPLFALAKQIQWTWPNQYGQFVFILGGLHIEMTVLKMIGQILSNSGWISVIEGSGVASYGTAQSMLHASNITKTRRALQVTVCALYKLLRTCYETDMILEGKDRL